MERMNACLLLQSVCRELQEARDLLIKVSETELADSAQTLYEKARCLLYGIELNGKPIAHTRDWKAIRLTPDSLLPDANDIYNERAAGLYFGDDKDKEQNK